MTDDPHSPTTAAPTPTVSAAGATTQHPAGTAVTPGGAIVAGDTGASGGDELPFGIPADRPEILVGAAFAGGLLAAIILKRLGGN
jgi:hypothetical protein